MIDVHDCCVLSLYIDGLISGLVQSESDGVPVSAPWKSPGIFRKN